MKITNFRDRVGSLPPDADETQIKQYVRVYLLCLLERVLFCDSSGDTVHFNVLLEDFDLADKYSWRSAALGFLYSQLIDI
jgi:hypothetical protein